LSESDNSPMCWWCGASANSQAHSVKRSRIKQIMNSSKEDSGEFLQICRDRELRVIRGPKSKAVKFERSMCANCNNARSQSFDQSYSDFLNYVLAKTWKFEEEPVIRWDEIYIGKDSDQRHLARYLINNFSCRAVEMGIVIPDDWISFMNFSDDGTGFDLIRF